MNYGFNSILPELLQGRMVGGWSCHTAQRVMVGVTVTVHAVGAVVATRSALSVGSLATLQENADSVWAPVMAAGGAQVPATDLALLMDASMYIYL